MHAWGAGQVHDEGLTVGASAEPDAAVRRRAVRMVAHLTGDPVVCAEVLSILGLDPAEGKQT